MHPPLPPHLTAAWAPAKTVKGLAAQIKAFVAGVKADPVLFAGADIVVAALEKSLAAVEAADATVPATTTSTLARLTGIRTLKTDMGKARVFAGGVADANLEQAATVFTKLGMTSKKHPVHHVAPFAVTHGANSGGAHCRIKAPGRKYSVEFRCSGDKEATWPFTGSSMTVSYDFTALTPGVLYSFQMRITAKGHTSDWSQTITLRII